MQIVLGGGGGGGVRGRTGRVEVDQISTHYDGCSNMRGQIDAREAGQLRQREGIPQREIGHNETVRENMSDRHVKKS